MTSQFASKPDPQDSISIRNFLMLFCRHMAAGELQKAVAMWETPALIMSDKGVQAIGSLKEIETFFAAAKDYYNAEGAIGTRPDIASIHQDSGGIATVEVRWPHLDEESNELGAEVWTYVLRRSETKEWKIHVGVLHGQVTNWNSGMR